MSQEVCNMKGSSALTKMVKAPCTQVREGCVHHRVRTCIHSVNVGSAEDAQEREPFGEGIELVGEKEMVASPPATEDDVLLQWSATLHKQMQATEVKRRMCVSVVKGAPQPLQRG